MASITEWTSEKLELKAVWFEEEEVFGGEVTAQCTEPGEVAINVDHEQSKGAGAAANLYMTPAQAYLLAERIRTAAWIAERLEADDE